MERAPVQRHVELRVRKYMGVLPAVVLLGARQVGKTTLAKKIASGNASVYLDLENPSDKEKLAVDPVGWLNGHFRKLIVIDEVHQLPGLFEAIRVSIDLERSRGHEAGKFLLLGSAAGRLMQQTSETLAGRAIRVHMHGLNVIEAENEFNLLTMWDKGMFPASLNAENDENSLIWRGAYLEEQVQREILALGKKILTADVIATFNRVALQQGSLSDISSMSNTLGIDRETLLRCLEVLEDMMLIRKLPAFDHKPGRSTARPVKYYCCDSGLFHAHRDTDVKALLEAKNDLLRGASWEGFVLENIASVMNRDWKMFYYRTVAGHEIDLILMLPGGKLWAIEIKSGVEKPELTKNMRAAIKHLNPDRTFVVYRGDDTVDIDRSTVALPLKGLMNELLASDKSMRATSLDVLLASPKRIKATQMEKAIRMNAFDMSISRTEYLEQLRLEIQRMIRESEGLEDAQAHARWVQTKSNVLFPFEIECAMDNFDADARGFFAAVLSMLEFMLAQKPNGLQESYLKHPSFAGMCAYDLFVSFIAVLLDHRKFALVHRLLSSDFLCRDELHSYTAFWIRDHGEESPISGRILANMTEAHKGSFVQAELVVMLHGLLIAHNKKDMMWLWHPHVFWNSSELDLPVFVRAAAPKDLQCLLECFGNVDPEHLVGCLDKHYEGLLMSRVRALYSKEYLREKLNMEKWGSIV